MFCLSLNPDLPAPVLGSLPIFPRRAGKHTIAIPYAPHLTRTDRLPVWPSPVQRPAAAAEPVLTTEPLAAGERL
jgi:hypothetical protein